LIPILVSLIPLPAIAVAIVAANYLGFAGTTFLKKNWGNIASVYGLGVSIYVLVVARGARRAAQEATTEAEAAAEASRAAARTRSALEELHVALSSSRQVSHHASIQNWQIVKLKAEEVMESCRIIVNRWDDTPALKDSKNSLNQAATLMRTIAEEANKGTPNGQRIVKTQLDAHGHISAVEGKILQDQDRRST
jgi:hypothetical protein